MLGRTNQGWIGVDVGERAIKVAQLRLVQDRLQLSATAITRRTEGIDGGLLEDLRTAKAVAEMARGTRVAATLSMRACLIEPAKEDAFASTDRCFASWSAGPDSAYTLSAPREQIEKTVDGFSRIGLQCEVIDGPPLAVARVLQLTPGYRRDALLGALDWGESTAVFIAATNGQARYARCLKAPGFRVVRQQVADDLGLSEPEADGLISDYGVSEPPVVGAEARLIDDTLRNAIRPVVQELKRTLEHLRGKLKVQDPERVLLMGSAATVPRLATAIGNALSVPAEPWNAVGLRDEGPPASPPDCLLAQAIALSALAWENREGPA